MNKIGLPGCGVKAEETYGYDPETSNWEKQEVPARCGDFQIKIPFEYDQRICEDCAVRLGLVW